MQRHAGPTVGPARAPRRRCGHLRPRLIGGAGDFPKPFPGRRHPRPAGAHALPQRSRVRAGGCGAGQGADFRATAERLGSLETGSTGGPEQRVAAPAREPPRQDVGNTTSGRTDLGKALDQPTPIGGIAWPVTTSTGSSSQTGITRCTPRDANSCPLKPIASTSVTSSAARQRSPRPASITRSRTGATPAAGLATRPDRRLRTGYVVPASRGAWPMEPHDCRAALRCLGACRCDLTALSRRCFLCAAEWRERLDRCPAQLTGYPGGNLWKRISSYEALETALISIVCPHPPNANDRCRRRMARSTDGAYRRAQARHNLRSPRNGCGSSRTNVARSLKSVPLSADLGAARGAKRVQTSVTFAIACLWGCSLRSSAV